MRFRRNARARRIILRMDRQGDGVIVTLPARASAAQGLRFATEQHGWIAARLTSAPDQLRFAPGAQIPLRGEPHDIVHVPERRGTVWLDAPQRICVAGDAAHLARRLRDFLIAEARRDLRAASERHAAAMAARFTRLVLRDPSGRWGSCSSDGTLNYSWRLIMAPGFVLDYVAAHEVAHLKEMNHGPDFWALVARHCARMEEAKAWLRRHGPGLQRYG